MRLDSTLSATARPFQPQATLPSSREDDRPRAYPFGVDGQGAVLLQASLLAHLQEGRPSATITPLMMMGYPLIPLSRTSPLTRGAEVEGVEVTGVVVTPMIPTPPEGGKRKRMDFLVRSKSLNLVARKDILMMWPMPLGSGPTVSPITVIIMRTPTSCPW